MTTNYNYQRCHRLVCDGDALGVILQWLVFSWVGCCGIAIFSAVIAVRPYPARYDRLW